MQTDVLIVGAGPTGLMLANQLARHGVRFLIIDRHSGPAQQTRAMAVQARTLEIYSKLGIIDQALALGTRGTGANMWANGKLTARIPVGDIGRGLSPYPFVLMLGQDDNERILGDKLREYGCVVHWNTELTSLEQHPTHVDATILEPDGTVVKIEAAWVAGCDGSRSSVRELNGIGFPGAPYEHTFFVADTEATGSMKPDEVNVYLWKDGFHLFFPMRGKDRWRVIGILPKSLRQRDGLGFDDVIASVKQEAGTDLNFTTCSWFSTYRIHHRAAERFRDRRCFVLGDAAHIHSPMGGQGMNTGLQDAYNLAWKLALVVKRRGNPILLDTYAEERRPVAETLLKTTDRAFQVVVSDTWLAGVLRTRVIARLAARAMTVERARKLAFRTLSQTGISYRKSSLSCQIGSPVNGAPAAGDRFPWLNVQLEPAGPKTDLFQMLDDTWFNLLLVGSTSLPTAALEEFAEFVNVLAIPLLPENTEQLARFRIATPSFYLLRPDGHIGLCGSTIDVPAILGYFAERVHLSTVNSTHRVVRALSLVTA